MDPSPYLTCQNMRRRKAPPAPQCPLCQLEHFRWLVRQTPGAQRYKARRCLLSVICSRLPT